MDDGWKDGWLAGWLDGTVIQSSGHTMPQQGPRGWGLEEPLWTGELAGRGSRWAVGSLNRNIQRQLRAPGCGTAREKQ